MLKAIQDFVRRRMAPDGARTVPEQAAAPRAKEVPPLHLAACALLLELAHADGEFSAREIDHIEGTLRRHFGLDNAEIAELMRLAEAERLESIDHFQFTRLLAQQYDVGQKMVLAEVMWGLVLADGVISDHEAYIVRKVANLMDLEPAYLAQAKGKAAGDRDG